MTHCATLLETLRQRGLRITPQREMIIEALAHGEDHLTAEEIHARVRQRVKAVNIATVYRTLDLLVAAGLASRLLLENGQQVFASSQHGPHVHLVCRVCGRIQKVDHRALLALSEHLKTQYHFEVDWQHLSLTGCCQDCQNIKS